MSEHTADMSCNRIRKEIIKQGYLSGRGHISSALSLVEIYYAIYGTGYFDIEKIKNNDPDRDRLILSKGHGALGLYVTLMQSGVISSEQLDGFATEKGILSTHPVKDSVIGIEMTAGSLGQGIGYAGGTALSAKLSGRQFKTVVIVGDGELQEGSNWESLLFIAHHKLDNITIIIDRNRLQISGDVDEIVTIEPLGEKMKTFGYRVLEVDGHKIDELCDALKADSEGMPKVIIANTVKGKGISFIENQNGWHGKGLNEEQYLKAKEELENVEW